MANMMQILRETEQVLQHKTAAARGKQALAGESPESLPGSEHDTKPPEGSTSADSLVADASMGPASARKVEGAKDDSPVTRGHALDADESAKDPVKKPLVTADADAKTAAIANDLLKDIQAWQASKAASEESNIPEMATTEPKKEEHKGDKKHVVPPPPAGTVEHKVPAEPTKVEEAKAAGSELELTRDVLAKIAAIALSYDDGAEFVSNMLERFAGQKAASDTMAMLEAANSNQEKQAAMEQGYRDAQMAINEQIFQAGVQAAKQASASNLTAAQLLKLGQEIAQGSMQDAMGAMSGGAPAGAPPAGPEGAPGAGGEQDYSIDDVAQALDMMVQNGEIKPEAAQEILQSIASGGDAAGGAPAEGGAPESQDATETLVDKGDKDEPKK